MCSLPLPRFPFPTRTYAIQMKQMNHNTTQIISRAPYHIIRLRLHAHTCSHKPNPPAPNAPPAIIPMHAYIFPLTTPTHARCSSIYPSIHCLTPITIHIARTNRYAPTPMHTHPHIYTHIAHKLIDTRPRSIHPRTAQINTAHVFHRPASTRPLIRSYIHARTHIAPHVTFACALERTRTTHMTRTKSRTRIPRTHPRPRPTPPTRFLSHTHMPITPTPTHDHAHAPYRARPHHHHRSTRPRSSRRSWDCGSGRRHTMARRRSRWRRISCRWRSAWIRQWWARRSS